MGHLHGAAKGNNISLIWINYSLVCDCLDLLDHWTDLVLLGFEGSRIISFRLQFFPNSGIVFIVANVNLIESGSI